MVLYWRFAVGGAAQRKIPGGQQADEAIGAARSRHSDLEHAPGHRQERFQRRRRLDADAGYFHSHVRCEERAELRAVHSFGEEVDYRGQHDRRSALAFALRLSALWAEWKLVLFPAGRSRPGHSSA